MRSDKMWSLPISAVAAIIYESIHSGAVKGSVDSDGAVYNLHGCARTPSRSGAREPAGVRGRVWRDCVRGRSRKMGAVEYPQAARAVRQRQCPVEARGLPASLTSRAWLLVLHY